MQKILITITEEGEIRMEGAAPSESACRDLGRELAHLLFPTREPEVQPLRHRQKEVQRHDIQDTDEDKTPA